MSQTKERAEGPGNRSRLLRGCVLAGLICSLPAAEAVHHMKRAPMAYVARASDTRPLIVTNQCSDTIFPGLSTSSGTGPEQQGFELSPGESKNLTVSPDWSGRVWGRTNCTFSNNQAQTAGTACLTGDCAGMLNCAGPGQTPVTLAEFTLASPTDQTFYDISVVDGYNLALAIVAIYDESQNASLRDIPPNLTNPACIGTASLVTPQAQTGDLTLGTNATFPLPLENSQSSQDVAQWCPFDLQQFPPYRPGNGVYPYPDSNIQRPAFDPCYSACAKYNLPQDCCTGSYDTPQTCGPNYYSTQAKAVCPDAYSYAYDDQDSTFIVPSGGGFQVLFCPVGRSTNILKTLGPQLRQLSQEGVTPGLVADTQNLTLIDLQENGAASSMMIMRGGGLTSLVGVWLLLWLLLLS